jgi:hypothetical protein
MVELLDVSALPEDDDEVVVVDVDLSNGSDSSFVFVFGFTPVSWHKIGSFSLE